MTKSFLLALSGLMLCGCAANYRRIKPETLSYENQPSVDSVSFGYQSNVLAKSKNSKYAKKEIGKAVKLLAFSITNNSQTGLQYGKNFKLYNGENALVVLSHDAVFHQLKQNNVSYLFYLTLSAITLTTSSETTNGNVITSSEKHVYPVGAIIGVPLALSNFLYASQANKRFRRELEDYSIENRVIKKGETARFLIGTTSTDLDAINLKLLK